MYSAAIYFGGLVRWLLKGCKTNFKDEVEGNLEGSWGGTYDFENFIIGIVSGVIFFAIILLLFF